MDDPDTENLVSFLEPLNQFINSDKLFLSMKTKPLNSDIFKANKMIKNFNEILYNIFMPLFEVTNDPNSHPYLHKFLYHVRIFIFLLKSLFHIELKPRKPNERCLASTQLMTNPNPNETCST